MPSSRLPAEVAAAQDQLTVTLQLVKEATCRVCRDLSRALKQASDQKVLKGMGRLWRKAEHGSMQNDGALKTTGRSSQQGDWYERHPTQCFFYDDVLGDLGAYFEPISMYYLYRHYIETQAVYFYGHSDYSGKLLGISGSPGSWIKSRPVLVVVLVVVPVLPVVLVVQIL
jgi:hypothetical protein